LKLLNKVLLPFFSETFVFFYRMTLNMIYSIGIHDDRNSNEVRIFDVKYLYNTYYEKHFLKKMKKNSTYAKITFSLF